MAVELNDIFNEIEPLLRVYIPPFVTKKDDGKWLELYANKPAEWEGRQRDATMFVALAKQKNFVGFYYFPIYVCPELKEKLHPALLKNLKGKTCFHIKKMDAEMLKHIKDALKIGLARYKKEGWV
jgi:hypothetical protein